MGNDEPTAALRLPPPCLPSEQSTTESTEEIVAEVMEMLETTEALAPDTQPSSTGLRTTPEGATVVELRPHQHPERTKDRVAIVGFTESRRETPWKDERYEVWGLNGLYVYKDCPRYDRWFDLHEPKIIPDGRYQAYGNMGRPVYLQQEHQGIPMSVRYPKAEVEAVCGTYMTNSISWMLGLAIVMGFKVIEIYGVDMAQDCLAPDTRVLTADLRWVFAGDVQVGDKLIGFDEHTGAKMPGPHANRQWRETEVLGRSTALRPSYRVHFEDGTSVVSSAGHQWLTYGEHQMKWKRTDELAGAMHRRPTRVVKLLDTWGEDRSWEAGYLASAFDGEGYLGQTEHAHCNGHTLNLGFAQRENAMADEVRMAMAMSGFEWGEVTPKQEGGSVMTKPTVSYAVQGGRPEIMRLLGQVRPRRLLDTFDASKLGNCQRKEAVAVERIEFLGEVETVGFTTSTATLVAEGFATHNSEYRFQRPNVEYLIGLARGMGIEVRLASTSDLLAATHQYGYGHDSGLRKRAKERLDSTNKRIAECDSEIQRLTLIRATLDGSRQSTEWIFQRAVADHTSMEPDAAQAGAPTASDGG